MIIPPQLAELESAPVTLSERLCVRWFRIPVRLQRSPIRVVVTARTNVARRMACEV
jgi:hypothetical protein